ncbi:MAG TPA: TIGR02594 family protein [Polyangiales bacterium]
MSPPAHLLIAVGELGIKEIPGSAHHPRILEYHATTRLHATTDEVPWCAAFVNWCLAQAKVAGTGSAAAASFRTWGVRSEPRIGCVVVFGKADRDAAGTGHVGFLVGMDAVHVFVLGGNQGNAVTVAKRPRESVVSYRWAA